MAKTVDLTVRGALFVLFLPALWLILCGLPLLGGADALNRCFFCRRYRRLVQRRSSSRVALS